MSKYNQYSINIMAIIVMAQYSLYKLMANVTMKATTAQYYDYYYSMQWYNVRKLVRKKIYDNNK